MLTPVFFGSSQPRISRSERSRTRNAGNGSGAIGNRPGTPLGYCRFGGQGRTHANDACAELVQGAGGCFAPAFERKRKANVVWYAVKRCAKRAGIGNRAPHDLRRNCARLCHGCGGELEQIQSLLGHASVQTRERYIRCKQHLREAVNDRFEVSVAGDSA